MPSSSEQQAADPAAASRRPRTTALGAYLEGWRRTLAAPQLVASLFLVTLLTAMPLAALVGETLEDRLASSTAAEQALGGWDDEWRRGMGSVAGGTFTLEMLGFGGVLQAVSALVNGESLPAELLGPLGLYLLLWVFVSGGIIDRMARARPLGADVFMATSGRFFLRLARFTVTAWAVYWALFRWLYPLVFETLVPWMAGGAPSESRLFVVQGGGYVLFLAVLGAFTLVADVARVRLVVEDRVSALASWSAGWRFVRRRPGRLAWLFLLNLAGQLVIARLWLQLLPGENAPEWLVLGGSSLFLVTRLWARVTFIASEVVFFQGELAHATYTSAPEPRWPDSAAVEALRGLRRPASPEAGPRLR